MEALARVLQPAFDVTLKALDGLGAQCFQQRNAVPFLLIAAQVIPPLQAIQPFTVEVRQRNDESTAAPGRIDFGESEIVLECARQFDIRHPYSGRASKDVR